ncbi:MAG: hypothetical protein ACRDEA_05160 [Microcystaceae cyanobacterium]
MHFSPGLDDNQDMPTELQGIAFQDSIRSLAQLRYCLYNIFLEGQYLYLEVKSCDDEQQRHLFILDPEGNL